jgi:hypothetical protein
VETFGFPDFPNGGLFAFGSRIPQGIWFAVTGDGAKIARKNLAHFSTETPLTSSASTA